jgi:hypothetical protein
MRRKIICIGVFALLSSCVLAQTTPKVEVFGGYSFLRSNPGSPKLDANASGWEASAVWNHNHWLGVKADFDGHYCCAGQKEHNFLFGPQFTIRRKRTNVFFHVMGGVSHGNASLSGFPETAAAWVVGGGLDLKLKRWERVSFRLAQLDYLGTHYSGAAQHQFRCAGGLVFRFGKK